MCCYLLLCVCLASIFYLINLYYSLPNDIYGYSLSRDQHRVILMHKYIEIRLAQNCRFWLSYMQIFYVILCFVIAPSSLFLYCLGMIILIMVCAFLCFLYAIAIFNFPQYVNPFPLGFYNVKTMMNIRKLIIIKVKKHEILRCYPHQFHSTEIIHKLQVCF